MTATCKCGGVNRQGQNNCHSCHAERMRLHRKTKLYASDEARRRSNTRSYLHVYVKRGKIAKGPCAVCGSLNVHGHHEDYSKPLLVKWLCEIHHLETHGKKIDGGRREIQNP